MILVHSTGLATRFVEVYGISPGAYITSWRLIAANKLLVETHHSIESVAREVGYKYPAVFTMAFIKRFTTPPGKYRSNYNSSANDCILLLPPTLRQHETKGWLTSVWNDTSATKGEQNSYFMLFALLL